MAYGPREVNLHQDFFDNNRPAQIIFYIIKIDVLKVIHKRRQNYLRRTKRKERQVTCIVFRLFGDSAGSEFCMSNFRNNRSVPST
jgi:hypothetical protein